MLLCQFCRDIPLLIFFFICKRLLTVCTVSHKSFVGIVNWLFNIALLSLVVNSYIMYREAVEMKDVNHRNTS